MQPRRTAPAAIDIAAVAAIRALAEWVLLVLVLVLLVATLGMRARPDC